MRFVYAKLWVKKYLRYNPNDVSNRIISNKLNWEIVKLSHRVCRRHGLKGHNIRQDIRKELKDYGNYVSNMNKTKISNRYALNKTITVYKYDLTTKSWYDVKQGIPKKTTSLTFILESRNYLRCVLKFRFKHIMDYKFYR
jgi:hypothetical protein